MTLNEYRNTHHRGLSKFKNDYGQIIDSIIDSQLIEKFNCISITYDIHLKPTKGKPTKKEPYRYSLPKKIDLGNIGSIASKVFLDCLSKKEIIPDDDIRYIQEEIYLISPWSEEEYIDISIKEIEPRPDWRLNGL